MGSRYPSTLSTDSRRHRRVSHLYPSPCTSSLSLSLTSSPVPVPSLPCPSSTAHHLLAMLRCASVLRRLLPAVAGRVFSRRLAAPHCSLPSHCHPFRSLLSFGAVSSLAAARRLCIRPAPLVRFVFRSFVNLFPPRSARCRRHRRAYGPCAVPTDGRRRAVCPAYLSQPTAHAVAFAPRPIRVRTAPLRSAAQLPLRPLVAPRRLVFVVPVQRQIRSPAAAPCRARPRPLRSPGPRVSHRRSSAASRPRGSSCPLSSPLALWLFC